MKKVLIIAAFALASLGINAQEGLKLGLNLGLPTGDAGELSSFSVGIDAYYFFTDSEDINFGVATGYTNAFGKSIDLGLGSFDVPDVSFLPVAAAARFSASDALSLGADLGYALGMNDNDGGFYYRPIVGYSISDSMEINGSYTGISLGDGFNWSTINLGVLFAL